MKLFEYIQDCIEIWILPDPWYYFWNDSILGFIILFILTKFISTFIHELGHAFMAKAVGFNVSKMDIAKLRFYNTKNGWKLKYVKENSFTGGHTLICFPDELLSQKFDLLTFNKKFKLFLLGGPLFQWITLFFIVLNFIIIRKSSFPLKLIILILLILSFLNVIVDKDFSYFIISDGNGIYLLEHKDSFTIFLYLSYLLHKNPKKHLINMTNDEENSFFEGRVKFVDFFLVEKMLEDKSIDKHLYVLYLYIAILCYIYSDISRAKELIFELEKYLAEIEEGLCKSKSLSEKKKKSWIDKFANELEEKENALERIKKGFGELKEIYNRKTANNLKG